MPNLPASHRFGVGPALALGVEEELLAVEPQTLRLTALDRALRGRKHSLGRLKPEVCDSMVELATPICTTAGEAVDAMLLGRSELNAMGVTALAAGVHPDGRFGDVRPGPGERYAAQMRSLQGLLARTPYCGMHVHVGMPDAEMAIRACNGMRKWIPLLIALGANSPFWHGQDSGFASARLALMRSLPRTGVPPAFRDYEDYQKTVMDIFDAGQLDDYTAIWWDVRPHPRLGTLEIRALDTQTSLRDAGGLIALIHCLAVYVGAKEADAGPSGEALDECCFRAMRDGRDALLRFEGELQPVPLLARIALGRIGPQALTLGCLDELAEVERVVREGNGADRQRSVHARRGMKGMVRALLASPGARRTRLDGPDRRR